MGTLRYILAVAVLLAHLHCSYMMTGGSTSVQSFYIVSGFFIAMILDTKYKRPDQVGLFYSNRLLRIFSIYWLFLLLSGGFYLLTFSHNHQNGLANLWVQYMPRMGLGGAAFLIASNLIIFGQDWLLFLKLGSYGLHLTRDFWDYPPILSGFMLVPQAWSLGVELSFYLLAPWILRRKTSVIVGLMVSTLLLRYVLWLFGLRSDPWSYRFFPFELGTFLLGALSYRLVYLQIKDRKMSWPWYVAGFGVFPAIALYPFYDHSQGLFFAPTQILFLACVALAVPILFRITGRNPIDRRIGELSYPFYLGHVLVIAVVDYFSVRLEGTVLRVAVMLIATSAISYLAVIFFDAPIDRYRQRRVERKNARDQVPAC